MVFSIQQDVVCLYRTKTKDLMVSTPLSARFATPAAYAGLVSAITVRLSLMSFAHRRSTTFLPFRC